MSRPKYTYSVEVEHKPGQWFSIVDADRSYCLGFFHGRRGVCPPRLAMRVTRSDGKVIDTREVEDRVSLGMVAGFPTPEQYEYAAEQALATAAKLRAMQSERRARRTP